MSKTGVGGKREDLGDIYFRSTWEANYARYLVFLSKHGKVVEWQYEPEIFRFPNVKRNPISYTPDFKVTYADGRVEWVEVKGFWDSGSRSKWKRMAKFYPEIRITVIGKEEYKAIAKWKALIPGWEEPEREKREAK
ncbi:MAG: DUF1064 domain-containing protein [Gaiellales bacterium]|nr:MAG: DUF1064 domain-containing protein [Gaiellales bacterium]